jgi:hypothetical protein
MKLADWLKQTNTRRYVFAEQIGVRRSVVTEYCDGNFRPASDVMERIVKVTNGAVTANDFLSDEARALIAGAAQ